MPGIGKAGEGLDIVLTTGVEAAAPPTLSGDNSIGVKQTFDKYGTMALLWQEHIKAGLLYNPTDKFRFGGGLQFAMQEFHSLRSDEGFQGDEEFSRLNIYTPNLGAYAEFGVQATDWLNLGLEGSYQFSLDQTFRNPENKLDVDDTASTTYMDLDGNGNDNIDPYVQHDGNINFAAEFNCTPDKPTHFVIRPFIGLGLTSWAESKRTTTNGNNVTANDNPRHADGYNGSYGVRTWKAHLNDDLTNTTRAFLQGGVELRLIFGKDPTSSTTPRGPQPSQPVPAQP